MSQEIVRGQIATALRKFFSLTGQVSPQLSETVVPTISLGSLTDEGDGIPWSHASNRTPQAAQYTYVGYGNRAERGSGVIMRVHSLYVATELDGDVVNIMYGVDETVVQTAFSLMVSSDQSDPRLGKTEQQQSNFACRIAINTANDYSTGAFGPSSTGWRNARMKLPGGWVWTPVPLPRGGLLLGPQKSVLIGTDAQNKEVWWGGAGTLFIPAVTENKFTGASV